MQKSAFALVLVCLLAAACGPSPESRLAYVNTHPDTAPHIKQAILANRVVVGMTAEQVIAVWGKPQDINRTVTSAGSSSQWVYYVANIPRRFVYLEGGRVTAVQY